ncbi:MAG TPA: biotin/lipoyl-binding carrier protein [Pseudonocardiaceae bacterium]|jgi:biotin carboxyl carrier protein|nr:biotin/lipoyl-binding carrier protein [Pseudonocardiaceae bacterium]
MAEEIRAEIVANVMNVLVGEGDTIGGGDTVVFLESMKMEIPVLAESGGVITKLAVHAGDVVQEGDLIAVVDQVSG